MIQIVSGYKTIFSCNWKLHFFLIFFVAVKDSGFIKVQFSLVLSQCIRSLEVRYVKEKRKVTVKRIMVRGRVWKVKDDILRVTSCSQTAPVESLASVQMCFSLAKQFEWKGDGALEYKAIRLLWGYTVLRVRFFFYLNP